MATDEIRLSTYGETIEIQQGLNGRVVLQVQTDDGHAAPVLTPPECDAIIAAIGRALGRPAPTSTPLSTEDKRAAVYRIQRAVPKGYAYSYTDLITDLGDAIGAELDRAAQGRETGPTVPRAGVLPILDDLRSIATALDFENTPGACSAWRRLEEAIGTLAKLTAAPTTQTEKG